MRSPRRKVKRIRSPQVPHQDRINVLQQQEVSMPNQKQIDKIADPVKAAIADLRAIVGVLDRGVCEKSPEEDLAQIYGLVLLGSIRKLLEACDE